MSAMPSDDPDGLACYSDHAEDVRVHGACTMCGSADPERVGHVLPDVERLTGVDPVAAAQKVLDAQTALLVDGVLLDTFSASAVVTIHAALSPENQQRLRSWPLVKAVDVCFRLANDRRVRQ